MRVIIIDDEANCIGALEILLQRYVQDVDILATCKSGEEGLRAIARHDPDLLFLDIAMPRMNGFEMLAKVAEPNFQIVFTTAYDEFAIQAFKVSATDYLLKPIDKDELIAAVEKAQTALQLRSAAREQTSYQAHWQRFLENIKQDALPFPNIAVPTAHGVEMIPAKDIIYVVADGNYSNIIMHHAKPFLVSRTLREVEEMLSAYGFIRVHHSHLVNTAEIARYVKGEGGYVVLKNGDHINVSRRRKPDLLKALKSA